MYLETNINLLVCYLEVDLCTLTLYSYSFAIPFCQHKSVNDSLHQARSSMVSLMEFCSEAYEKSI